MDAEETLSSSRVFDGKIVGVRVDTVRLPDGRQATREVVEHRPDVVVVAIDDEDQVLLVRQYRYPIVQDLLEAPAGIVEQGESREACAQRELREETGYRGTRMESLGRFWMSPGHSTELNARVPGQRPQAQPAEPGRGRGHTNRARAPFPGQRSDSRR